MLLLSSIVRLLIDQFVSNLISLSSSHLRWSRFHNLRNLCLWNSWSGKLLLVEFGFPGFGICNPAQRIQNLTSDWNSKSNFYCWTIWNPLGGIQNPRMSWVTVITRTIECQWKIDHFRVPKTLTFKMRPSAQPFLWKWLYLYENEKSLSY